MNHLSELLSRLSTAENIVIFTGAGVSAESGIATFRDPGGLWAKFNPAELASADGFMANPERVWGWYQYRRNIIDESSPNAGHFAMAQMQKMWHRATVITQNVDRLHQKAGARGVIELHGNIIENHCFECSEPYLDEIDLSSNKNPQCGCGGMIRPSVVWFGEMLPALAMKKAEISAMKSEVFFSIGTSAEVYPAANLPILAKENGAYVVEVNPNETAISDYMNLCVRENSAEFLPKLLIEYKKFLNK